MWLKRLYYWLFPKYTPFGRSPKWKSLRDNIIKEKGKCSICEGIDYLAVHHIIPYHVRPELELTLDNLVVLCENPKMNCHFLFAHRRNWKDWNPNIMNDIGTIREILDI